MVFYSDRVDPADDEELLVINNDKEEDAEMQMLTPIMLESMWQLHSPPDIFRMKDTDKLDKLDDATVMTTESFSNLLLPTFDTPPRITAYPVDDDDTSEVSLDSYARGEAPSPRTIVFKGIATHYPLRIPADIRYEGEVSFLSSNFPRRINLQPRRSAMADAIFVPKTFTQGEPMYYDHALADSLSLFDDKDGAEECKDDECERSRHEEGFEYLPGDRFKEEQYWGNYDGHYGSRDFEHEDRNDVDYAMDHASVQEFPIMPSVPSIRYEMFTEQPREQSFIDDIYDFFTVSCFSCSNIWLPQSHNNSASSNPYSPRRGGSFEPDDYGVSPRADMRYL